MRLIIIIGMSVFAQTGFAQLQQQVVTNFSNSTIQYRGNLNNNSNTLQANAKVFKAANLTRNTIKTLPTNRSSQVKINAINKTSVTSPVKRPRQIPHIINNVAKVISNPKSINGLEIINKQFVNVTQTILSNQVADFINVINTNFENGSNSFLVNSIPNNISNQEKNSNVVDQRNFNLDLAFNLKVSSRIKTKSSSHLKSYHFSRMFAKFKRNFFGKLASHKKSKHRLDVCFSWKK